MWDPDPTLRFLYAHLEPALGHPLPSLPFAKNSKGYDIPIAGGLLEVRLRVEEGLLISYEINNLAHTNT